jgi:hypothetical protein
LLLSFVESQLTGISIVKYRRRGRFLAGDFEVKPQIFLRRDFELDMESYGNLAKYYGGSWGTKG